MCAAIFRRGRKNKETEKPTYLLPFQKWEGLGNDFLIVWTEELQLPEWDHLTRRICERHFGVGADGILRVELIPPRMLVHNADGSRPEMCGNGLRCVIGAISRRNGIDVGELTVDTDAGLKKARFERTDERSYDVTVNMGIPSFEPADAGFDGPARVEVPGIGEGHVVSIGNPHWVFFNPAPMAKIHEHGPLLELDGRFANRTNVEFVTVFSPTHVKVDVWERGVGVTLACGSGAVCVAAALVRTGRSPVGEDIRVDLPGGPLFCQIGPNGAVAMRGPARLAFEGSLDLAHFGLGG